MADEDEGQLQVLQKRLQSLTELTGNLVGRATLMSRLGSGYGGERDIYSALGYNKDPQFRDFYVQYRRQDIAKAIIDRPVGATWRGKMTVVETDNDQETTFEKAWKELDQRLHVKAKFARVDRLAGLGKYGVLLLGLDDVRVKEDMQKPAERGNRKLLYVKPFSQNSAEIKYWESNANNERYGLPTIYQLTLQSPGDKTNIELHVHHSRIIHIPNQLMESEVEGLPRLEVVYNRLKDLEKTVGGSAEMFWRGARPGYQGKVDKEYSMGTEDVNELQKQITEYENDLRRILVNEGVDLDSLSMQVADPSNHVDIQIQMISAVTGIPKRVLTGSERGEQASTQDRQNWLELIQERRDEYAEPVVARPFIDKCIQLGILPGPKQENEDYTIQWPDLWAQSDKEKADVGKIKAEALKSYSGTPGTMDLMPPDAFYQLFLGLDENQIELIKEMQEAQVDEEEQDFDNGSQGGGAGEAGQSGEEEAEE